MTNDNHYAAVYIFYNFAIYKCDQESVYVTICLLFLVNVLHKLVYSVNLTSQLPLWCAWRNDNLRRPVSD